ncbi:ATP-binding protein [Actinokineospora auranticolor]|uniref:ATPase family protein associated with various cellular activities (AAA) n=1 Tax=Actinokineospora auranticolor TaxID=155976 RepID=A0A2S6GC43_9PSEU|nr:ATP-binding protein [Actinokineospora auranticolor]PPK61884.1 hypothetical protein CLV40_13833 [Actinokineospora auranticolor]
MPLPGGAADKMGNRFERWWTVHQLIEVLTGRARSLQIEVPGPPGTGAEFCLTVDGVRVWHQVKRQRAGGPWTVAALVGEGVVAPWWDKILDGGRCVFVSATSADELRELVERASAAESWEVFDAEFLDAQQHRTVFQRLRDAWSKPPSSDAFKALEHIDVATIGEPELIALVEARLEVLFEHPQRVADSLGRLIDESVHHTLTAERVWTWLAERGVHRRDVADTAVVADWVATETTAFKDRVAVHHIDGERIPRTETVAAIEALAGGARQVLVAGSAGSGKSVITGEIVDSARRRGWAVLAVALDARPDAEAPVALSGEVVRQVRSPVAALAAAAQDGVGLLVLDQADAISAVSGRLTGRRALLTDWVIEARRHPAVRIVIACREFDLDHDSELRALAQGRGTRTVTVDRLDAAVVRDVLSTVDARREAPPDLVDLLAHPLALTVYVELVRAGDSGARDARDLNDLWERYWRLKKRVYEAKRGTEDWQSTIEFLVDHMSRAQTLEVPIGRLLDHEDQIALLVSEGMLRRDTERHVSFFHETLFDYCAARVFVSRGGTLHRLLIDDEQRLFRRFQVRAILTYLRTADPRAYSRELAWLLSSSRVRNHVKAIALALPQVVPNPRSDEWDLLAPIATDVEHPLCQHVWRAVRANPAWFPVIDAAGTWRACLRSPHAGLVDQAISAMSGMTTAHNDQVARLIQYLPYDDRRPARLRVLLNSADIQEGSQLEKLAVEATITGVHDGHESQQWFLVRRVMQESAVSAIRLVAAMFAFELTASQDHPLNSLGLLSIDHRTSGVRELLRSLAVTASHPFAQQFLPHLARAMTRNDHRSESDAIRGLPRTRRLRGLGISMADSVLNATCLALQTLAGIDHHAVRDLVTPLRSCDHGIAQLLVAHSYMAAPEQFADEAAEWIIVQPTILDLGPSSDDSRPVARRLLEAISPFCSQSRFERLAATILAYKAPDAVDDGRDRVQLELLNALPPDRISPEVGQRLTGLRCALGIEDFSYHPMMTVLPVVSPISETDARAMTDPQWIDAIEKYDGGGHPHYLHADGAVTGGAAELAQVLETITREQPQRFAEFMLCLPLSVSSLYVNAIVSGLADSHLDLDLLEAVCQRARVTDDTRTQSKIIALVEAQSHRPLTEPILALLHTFANSKVSGPTTRAEVAGTMATMIHRDNTLLPRLTGLLTSLSNDENPNVSEMVIHTLVTVLDHAPDLAFELFRSVTEKQLAAHPSLERFLNRAIQLERYDDVVHLIETLHRHSEPKARLIAVRATTFASYWRPDLDAYVDALLGDGDVDTRETVTQIAAHNVTTTHRQDRTQTILIRAFEDPAPEVQNAAAYSLFNLENEQLGEYDTLLIAYSQSKVFDRHTNSTVFHMFTQARHSLPRRVIDLCYEFFRRHEAKSLDTLDAVHYLFPLILRLLFEHPEPPLQTNCLDLLDKLVLIDVFQANQELDKSTR